MKMLIIKRNALTSVKEQLHSDVLEKAARTHISLWKQIILYSGSTYKVLNVVLC